MTPKKAIEQAADRIAKLRSEIRHHEYLYYVEDRPAISDTEFDRLFHELEELEKEHPDLVAEDSPTQRVAGTPVDGFPTVAHAAPMLSLDSSQDEAALRRFDERLRKGLGPDVAVEYVLEPKLDGLSVELVYRDGVLLQAATRGDGRKGEGITANVRTITSVPLKLRDSERPVPPFLSIRGEIIMFAKDFDRLNERLIAEGKEPFASPRNSAAGSVRQLDPQLTASRRLHLYAYDILASEGVSGLETQWDVLMALRAWGLKVNERVTKGATVDDILAYHAGFEAERDDLGYEIDGVVIKLDDLAHRDTLGWTSRHPRWAFAYKFPPRKEITRILSILPSVGRTGVVTPVALMLPVEIGGVTVARATLHNREEVARKDVREGDRVRVQRAGDVIPQVIERIEEPDHERAPEWRMPDACPSCGTALIERGPFTVCPNSFECPAQLAGRIVHFASRDALDIEGLGDETAKLFVAEGLVRQLPDLFEIRAEQLLHLEGFAQKSANKLVDALKKAAAAAELPRFLYGLGIPEVGVAVARDLARHFGTLARLRAADETALQEVPGVGPRMSQQILDFFGEPKNAAVLDELTARLHLVETEPSQPSEEGATRVKPLAGQKWVFTGGLTQVTRRDAQGYVESLGARATGSVSKATDVVVVGEDAGSKAEDARKLGVQIMNEEEFLVFLRGNGIAV
ncbi:MAG TPA: NAD-dependent DNA ligase LigA [Thermoanaerobaculia bacterium]|jgi:DNA ligase (NAD+)|nr:NAD-dependent DNA ligase LigA [Thermoanaerobaculia bacterium]